MATALETELTTVADLLEQLGDIPSRRVLLKPLPGTATEDDLLRINGRKQGIYELVDGTLVQKGMGYEESVLGTALSAHVRAFVNSRNLGVVSGEAGMMRLFPGLVRAPDVAFASWDRFPGRRLSGRPIPDLVPDLAIEVLSQSNTLAEMQRKRQEYFAHGVRLVWMVDQQLRNVTVYTAPDESVLLNQAQTLDGGDVLPGFSLSLVELFAELDRQG